MTERYDVVVVGAGPGGYTAAIRSAQLGLATALVEEKRLGGICLNWGCIPTKALLKGAELAHLLTDLERFGFHADNVRLDLAGLVRHSRAAVDRLVTGVEYLMKKNGITLMEGRARLTGKGALSVRDESGGEARYTARHIIVATGARPRQLPNVRFDSERIWSYFQAVAPESLPGSIVVIGAGAIGVEFASLYHDLGADVTLVEMRDRILPAEDAEVSLRLRRVFEKRGIRVRTGTQVAQVQQRADTMVIQLQGGGEAEAVAADRVILAAGVQGNIEDLGLERLGVNTRDGFIDTDAWGRTSVAGVYAIGDVTGPPCLAHRASHAGVVCVERLAGVAGVRPLALEDIPACTYCRPQVARLGMTEAEAEGSGRRVRVGRFDLNASGKAVASGDDQGMVKAVFDDDTGELLGAHMIGPEVTELIQGFSIARAAEATDAELARTVFPHPTVSEAMHEAVLHAMHRPLHQ
ncbi:MAG: dihydrolipoyl dehydrogenase [Gammaproteobacteria bacterium]|nr:dihydrolipoyl dehydrogenase [Gammaproteobacteria bacterium]